MLDPGGKFAIDPAALVKTFKAMTESNIGH